MQVYLKNIDTYNFYLAVHMNVPGNVQSGEAPSFVVEGDATSKNILHDEPIEACWWSSHSLPTLSSLFTADNISTLARYLIFTTITVINTTCGDSVRVK